MGESSPVVEDNLRLDSDKNDVFAGDMEGLLLESSIMGESSPILEDNLCLDSDQSVSEATTRLFRVGDVYVLSELRELTRSFGVKWYLITLIWVRYLYTTALLHLLLINGRVLKNT